MFSTGHTSELVSEGDVIVWNNIIGPDTVCRQYPSTKFYQALPHLLPVGPPLRPHNSP